MCKHIFILLLGVGAFTVVGCNQQGPQASPPPPTVYVSQPILQEVSEFEDFTGRTEAMRSIEIRARVTGYLLKANFKEGALVHKGDLLFEVDPRLYQALYEQALSQVALNQASLALAKASHARNVSAGSAISPQELDQTRAAQEEAAARVRASDASLEISRINLAYTKVTSPIDGRVGRVLLDPGNLVKADESILATVVSQDPMYVYFDMDERTLQRIGRLGPNPGVDTPLTNSVQVFLALSEEQGFLHRGVIDFMDNRVDPNTGTIRVRGVFPNPEWIFFAPNPLRIPSPGLFARVRLPLSGPHPAILVPEMALGTDQGQKFLYVVNDKNEVVFRKVKTGSLLNGLRVIEEGVQMGEKVIVNGLQRVRPGAKVVAKPAGQEKAEGKAGTPKGTGH
jgi:RND family efflux transporter MFP subunit